MIKLRRLKKNNIINNFASGEYKVKDLLVLNAKAPFKAPKEDILYKEVKLVRNYNLDLWIPVVFPFDVDTEQCRKVFGSNVKIWELCNVTDEGIDESIQKRMYYVNVFSVGSIEAGKPYILKPSNIDGLSNVPNQKEITFYNVVIKKDVTTKVNEYTDTYKTDKIFAKPLPVFGLGKIKPKDMYISTATNKWVYFPGSNITNYPGFKCLLIPKDYNYDTSNVYMKHIVINNNQQLD